MPATRNRVYFGTVPNGVSSPWGLVTTTTDPTVAPRLSAISLPRTIGGMAVTLWFTAESESGGWAGLTPLPAVFGSGSGVTVCGGGGISASRSSKASADPCFTELSRSPTWRSYFGIIPFRTAPRARGPREMRTCSKIAGAAATTCGCLESRSMRGGHALMPSSAIRWRVMCEVEPSRRCCRSWRKPLLIASATIKEATPAATPTTEIPVMMPINA